ncbi:fructokinase-like 2, chloroplastic isoform X1 [Dioscorea cayenensis subsp. rotundata]|uniref:Fructokinase-like 2, chloroplastic isoform X1 n=1 Tax=Dioscorea cayennensis subsp. rotundata TaxID=55577 RepID=A0AB40CSM2_DIOCR|nr:fructokinase-like 2, chloroplastic isoform X1 [Dioscorea cayenensis subsp. rotundata]
MASLTFICSLPLLRNQTNCAGVFLAPNLVRLQNLKVQKLLMHAVSRKAASQIDSEDGSDAEIAETPPKKTRRTPRRSRKQVAAETCVEGSVNQEENVATKEAGEEESTVSATSVEEPKKTARRGRKKAASLPNTEESAEKKTTTRRRSRKKTDKLEDKSMSVEPSDADELQYSIASEGQQELDLDEHEGEDISYTYSWPPLVCCFGAAQHSFIPSGRPANRLIDHEIHERNKGMLWHPSKFVRAPGGSASSVAVALTSLGGRVAFMGKLGDDEYGQSMLYHLNLHGVQTRSIKLDEEIATAVSHMKISRRGDLKMTCVKPCAEDSFLAKEINVDVLKEATMFYFNSTALLDPNMRFTTMQAVKAFRKLGGVVFFDLNLPMPLWHSSEETKAFIQQAWNSADVVEVTKKELEFLCGIQPSEKFDTEDNDKSKFTHYAPELVKPLWHENLKVLFMTNGTSKIHYYTEEVNGSVHGMEDAPITPFTGDMSASGDAIVAALMRMLTVQPHLITDKSYLEHMSKYAINCGVIDQWMLARIRGFPPRDSMEGRPTGYGSTRSISERDYRSYRSFTASNQ